MRLRILALGIGVGVALFVPGGAHAASDCTWTGWQPADAPAGTLLETCVLDPLDLGPWEPLYTTVSLVPSRSYRLVASGVVAEVHLDDVSQYWEADAVYCLESPGYELYCGNPGQVFQGWPAGGALGVIWGNGFDAFGNPAPFWEVDGATGGALPASPVPPPLSADNVYEATIAGVSGSLGFLQQTFANVGELAVEVYVAGEAPVEPPSPGDEDPLECDGKDATITPNPDAPAGFAISGTASDDVIVGTPGADRILGLGGNDTICGFGGDDELIGAEGDDLLYGGLGDDTLDGGAGDDSLWGDFFSTGGIGGTYVAEGGNDQLFGGDGKNYLEGGPGNDELVGGPGKDELHGGYRQGILGVPESAMKGPDDDQLDAGADKDQLWGGKGNDLLNAGAGDDTLNGGSGKDTLSGKEGTDRLEGGTGDDRLDGGSGGEHKWVNDLFGDVTSYFEAVRGIRLDLGAGLVTGGLGRDTIRGIESVIGSRYRDILRGSGRPDWLAGDTGHDDLYGRGGGDTLIGGAGDDLLIGGPGSDSAFGGPDTDGCSAERRYKCERLLVGPGTR